SVSSGPLTALASSAAPSGNGLYNTNTTNSFPNLTYNANDYYVDVVFASSGSGGGATAPSAPTGVSAAAGNAAATVSWTAPANGGSPITSYTVTPYVGTTAQTATTVTGSPPATSTTVTGLTNGTSYTFVVIASNAVGASPPSAASAPVTPSGTTTCTACTILGTATPAVADGGSTPAVLGVAFESSVAGSITGIRFYKASTNTGTHIGSLWTATGTLLASVTFTGESASGWQTASFSSAVAIAANTVYVASYSAPSGHWSYTAQGFATSVSSGPLTALASSAAPSGNGLYNTNTTNSFPNLTYNANDYYVDVVFRSP
ncbi:MAG TPA: DUF4082 domain-containing protein, partial [Actinomycetota bacterium]|nr:DUF4082 domain-containing protein [Actinomycetota bacterium]